MSNDDIISIVVGFGAVALAYMIGRFHGYSRGLDEGYDMAAKWRDEVIKRRDEMLKQFNTMFEEAIRQRNEARQNRIVLPQPPNPFATKEWN